MEQEAGARCGAARLEPTSWEAEAGRCTFRGQPGNSAPSQNQRGPGATRAARREGTVTQRHADCLGRSLLRAGPASPTSSSSPARVPAAAPSPSSSRGGVAGRTRVCRRDREAGAAGPRGSQRSPRPAPSRCSRSRRPRQAPRRIPGPPPARPSAARGPQPGPYRRRRHPGSRTRRPTAPARALTALREHARHRGNPRGSEPVGREGRGEGGVWSGRPDWSAGGAGRVTSGAGGCREGRRVRPPQLPPGSRLARETRADAPGRAPSGGRFGDAQPKRSVRGRGRRAPRRPRECVPPAPAGPQSRSSGRSPQARMAAPRSAVVLRVRARLPGNADKGPSPSRRGTDALE